jgi:flagellar protein FlaG
MMTGSNTIMPTVAAPKRPAATVRSVSVEPVATVGGNDAPASGKTLPARPRPEITATADVEKAVQQLNELARESRRGLRFRVDEGSGRTVITVLNASTDEIVRQIPSEEILAIARAVRHAQLSASLIDERA